MVGAGAVVEQHVAGKDRILKTLQPVGGGDWRVVDAGDGDGDGGGIAAAVGVGHGIAEGVGGGLPFLQEIETAARVEVDVVRGERHRAGNAGDLQGSRGGAARGEVVGEQRSDGQRGDRVLADRRAADGGNDVAEGQRVLPENLEGVTGLGADEGVVAADFAVEPDVVDQQARRIVWSSDR